MDSIEKHQQPKTLDTAADSDTRLTEIYAEQTARIADQASLARRRAADLDMLQDHAAHNRDISDEGREDIESISTGLVAAAERLDRLAGSKAADSAADPETRS